MVRMLFVLFWLLMSLFAIIGLLFVGKSKKKKCPNCKMEVYNSALKCKHCNTLLDFSPKSTKLNDTFEKQIDIHIYFDKLYEKNKRVDK
jgi:hypothetical protein